MKADLRLYALLDPAQTGRHALNDLAAAVARGGVTLVQLRDKNSDTRTMIARARGLKKTLAPAGVAVLVNDRVDVALAARADGVHLGQDDMPADMARVLLGEGAIIGLSVRSEEEALAAPLHVLDYVAIGGVFGTLSKKNETPPVGIAGLGRLAAIIRTRKPGMPIVAIAGIDETNAADVIAAGADGVAVISALAKASDPRDAAERLRACIDTALQERLSA